MQLDAFIATLRADRENRTGPGLYASDKVFALLDRLDALASPQPAVTEEAVERVAARLWKAETEDAGVPRSATEARTPDAFRDASEGTRARWFKFARAVLEASLAAEGRGA